jgi:iron-sulfur cluster assembly accessory protein
MSANQTTTTPTATPVPSAPSVSLSVTEPAAGEIKKFMSSEEGLPETAGLRVRVVPGGCSGFQYSLNIEEESRQGDFVLDDKGVRLFVDMFSAQYLNGVEIDYVQNVMGSGFTFKNPNSTGSCGCGSSFTA